MIKAYIPINPEIIGRVMKENLWTKEYTLRVVDEYRKFIFLSTIQDVAPSFEVDQVWHCHLLYSKDYETMEKIIGKKLYHKPNTGERRFLGKDEYAETLELYRNTFKYDPPSDIWTRWKHTNYVYIDLNTHWVVKEGDWKALLKIFFKFLRYGII